MLRDEGRWCISAQPHRMLPGRPQDEVGTGAGPWSLCSEELQTLEMPNNSSALLPFGRESTHLPELSKRLRASPPTAHFH